MSLVGLGVEVKEEGRMAYLDPASVLYVDPKEVVAIRQVSGELSACELVLRNSGVILKASVAPLKALRWLRAGEPAK